MIADTMIRTDGKFLTFALGDEEYGFEILKVREIFGLTSITPIPRTPMHIKGVINLRGQVIPVLDLRLKFGMMEIEPTDQTCIIVVETELEGKIVSTGIIVDKVSEVQNISSDDVDPAPEFGTMVDTECILGIGKINDTVKILLDIDKILDVNELSMI